MIQRLGISVHVLATALSLLPASAVCFEPPTPSFAALVAGGDQQLALDRSKALRQYRQALQLAALTPSSDDDLQAVERLAWAGALESAIDYLRHLVRRQPQLAEGHIMLARYLAWSGRPRAALEAIDAALAAAPDHPEALAVKANAFSWQGAYDEALPLYERVLNKDDSFDARLDYTYALIHDGRYEQAVQSLERLDARSPRQRASLETLANEYHRTANENIHVQQAYFIDSDNNRIDSSAVSIDLPAHRSRWTFHARSLQASDSVTRASQNRFALEGGGALGRLRGTARLGVMEGGRATGRLNLQRQWRDLGWGIEYVREPLAETARTIERGLLADGWGTWLSHHLGDRALLRAQGGTRIYTDGNRVNKAKFDGAYRLTLSGPRMRLGYRYEFEDYAREPHDGYFSPQGLQGHQLYWHASYRGAHLEASLDLYAGKQFFGFYGQRHDNDIAGWYADLQWRPRPGLQLALQWEGGDFALGYSAGYRYQQVSAALVWIPGD